jgi:hypothetical protein
VLSGWRRMAATRRCAVGLWSPVDHVPKRFRKEDDNYYGERA